jgi:hypothetical protein
MSDIQKEREERAIIGFFREVYNDFPRGKLVKSESPDFILKLNRKRSIGIELTKLFKYSKDPDRLPRKKPRSLYKRIVEEAKMLYGMKSDLPLNVHIAFPADVVLPRARAGDTASRIVNAIRIGLMDKDLTTLFNSTIIPPEAPFPVSEINILYNPSQRSSIWNYAEVFNADELTESNVKKLILHKEGKLQIYQKNRFDSYWLIVVVDALSHSSSFNIHNKIENWEIETDFNKLFLFEQFNQKIYELK